MEIVPVRVDVTTNAGGAGTTRSNQRVNGKVYAVQLVDGTFDDGVDVTLTVENDDLSVPVLVKADFNTDQMVYPRVLEALNTDGTALTTHTEPIACGFPKAVVAAGGNAKSGSFIFFIVPF